MSTIICSMGVTADGYIADANGDISWGAPSPERFTFNSAQIAELSAYVMGRRLYDMMLVWEEDPAMRSTPAYDAFAHIWAAIPKIVFSTTLTEVTGNARLATGTLAEELSNAPEGQVSVGGANLVAQCVELDLIDEFRQFVSPIVVGGGTPYFPPRAASLQLEVLETRTFPDVVYVNYGRVRG